MKENIKLIISLLLIILLLPLLITALISGREACPIIKEVEVEDYLPAIVAMEIPWNYSKEAIKAQAIVSRSNLYTQLEEGAVSGEIKHAVDQLKENKMDDDFLERFQNYQEAVQETEGKILCNQGKLTDIPYCRLSGGKTRDGKEVLGDTYAYVPSVDTGADIDSEDYLKGFYFTSEEIEEKLKTKYPGFAWGDSEEEPVKIIKTDSTDYVLEIQVGNQEFQGEELRDALGLTSSCFTVQDLGEKIRFLCKGIGHGMGMSQYTADQMGKEGKNYKEIITYFFPDLEIQDVKTVIGQN